MIAGAVHDRDGPPRQPGELGGQTGLVGLGDQQVLGAAVDQEAGVVALGVQRVGGDQRTGKVQAGQQRLELGDLVGRRGHLALGEHGAVMVVQRCQQVHLVAVAGRAPQRLAVHRDATAVTQRVEPVGQPRADGGITASPSTCASTRRMVASPGTWQRRVSGSRRTPSGPARQDRPGRIRGPLGDRGHAAGAGRYRRGADGQHAGQGMSSSPPVTGSGSSPAAPAGQGTRPRQAGAHGWGR